MKKQYISQKGLEKVKKELEDLKKNKLVEIKKQYQQALSYGDTSENAELDQVKQDKRMLERRIRQLESTIKYATVIDENGGKSNGKLNIGGTVKFQDLESKEVREYQIVGVAESDPLSGKISNESPIGRALLGKEAGDVVEIMIPSGKSKVKIIEVK